MWSRPRLSGQLTRGCPARHLLGVTGATGSGTMEGAVASLAAASSWLRLLFAVFAVFAVFVVIVVVLVLPAPGPSFLGGSSHWFDHDCRAFPTALC